MKNKSLLITIVILFIAVYSFAQATGTFTDSRDGKTYKTVKIGTQTWMAENFAYKAKTGCWLYNNDQNNLAIYGYLYDWETAKKSCPSGWHLPSEAEWKTLTNYLGGPRGGACVAGGKLKEKGTTHWKTPNSGATNESGFSAVPGGIRMLDGTFDRMGNVGYWWSSTEYNSDVYKYTSMGSGNSCAGSDSNSGKTAGFSVRYIKD
ncbi:MAG: FISUMP domain-containing protein [Bacteroidota bacterium]